jgi:hypothetical protein
MFDNLQIGMNCLPQLQKFEITVQDRVGNRSQDIVEQSLKLAARLTGAKVIPGAACTIDRRLQLPWDHPQVTWIIWSFTFNRVQRTASQIKSRKERG